MKILKPGDPCPCCGQPIPEGLSEWKMVFLGYIAEGISLRDAYTTASWRWKEARAMADIKEKLVELLTESEILCNDCGPHGNSYCVEAIADHLISNGVTIQQWISVEERLPGVPLGWNENPEPVFFIVKGQGKVEAGYYGENGLWRDKYFRTYRDGCNGYDADDVLCWMWQAALPEPPKGE